MLTGPCQAALRDLRMASCRSSSEVAIEVSVLEELKENLECDMFSAAAETKSRLAAGSLITLAVAVASLTGRQ
jgi:hypothetical protein